MIDIERRSSTAFELGEPPPSSSAPPDDSLVYGTGLSARTHSGVGKPAVFGAGVLIAALAFPGIPAVAKTGPTRENKPPLSRFFEQPDLPVDRVMAGSTAETELPDLLRVEKARREFRRFLSASRAERSELADIIRATVGPDDLFTAAYEDYRVAGNERRLVLLINLLAGFRGAAVPALSRAAEDPSDDVELFVDLTAELEGVTDSARARLLGRFAASPSSLVRMRVVDHIDALGRAHARELIEKLRDDADEEIAAAAQDALQVLAAS